MTARNYYLILGVAPDASPEQIKAAYRRQVKKFHPDYYGQDSQPFREVQEAYEVLSDPARRRAYDETLARENRPRVTRTASPWSRSVSPEPLIPTDTPDQWIEPLFERSRPSIFSPFETLFDDLWRDFHRPARWESGWREELQVELRLTAAQARRGGQARLVLPVTMLCPGCRGRGGIGFFECSRCAGRGEIITEYPLTLRFPAGVSDGDTARISLQRWGLNNWLTVHFRVT